MSGNQPSGRDLPGFDATTDYWQSHRHREAEAEPVAAAALCRRAIRPDCPTVRYSLLPLRGMPTADGSAPRPLRGVADRQPGFHLEVVEQLAQLVAYERRERIFRCGCPGLPTLGRSSTAPRWRATWSRNRCVPLELLAQMLQCRDESASPSSITTPGRQLLLYRPQSAGV